MVSILKILHRVCIISKCPLQVPGHHPPAVLPDAHDAPPGHQPDRPHLAPGGGAEHAAALRLGLHRLRPAPQRLHGGLVVQLVLLGAAVGAVLLAAGAGHAGLLLDGVQGGAAAERAGAPHTAGQQLQQPAAARLTGQLMIHVIIFFFKSE